MKKVIIAVILMLLPLACFAQGQNSVVSANNQFASELYSRYQAKDGNIFFSPYSISSALAIAYEGARGQTADQIQAVFHFPKDNSIRRESFLNIGNEINKQDKQYRLKAANALWAQKDFTFLSDYLGLIRKYYGVNATNLDFVNDAENSRITINNWVEEQTDNKIQNLIPAGILNHMTRLVITNAIYFKGKWADRFDKNNTKEKDFKVSPGTVVRAHMMKLTDKEAKFNYAETDNLQVLEIPYEGNELSMLILLPKDNNLEAAQRAVDPEKLAELKNSLKKQRVDIYIPKFKFQAKYFMAEDLKEMGMPIAFSLLEADFSGMTGKNDLYIGEVIHQAFVDVNEEGTEASAATAAIMYAKSIVFPGTPKIFNADHPFIFIIQERASGNILFIGRVSDPTRA